MSILLLRSVFFSSLKPAWTNAWMPRSIVYHECYCLVFDHQCAYTTTQRIGIKWYLKKKVRCAGRTGRTLRQPALTRLAGKREAVIGFASLLRFRSA